MLDPPQWENHNGHLISPFKKEHGTVCDGPIYEILAAVKHSNLPEFDQPFVVAQELDANTVFDPANPQGTPPYALMVRARTAGRYAVNVLVGFNRSYARDLPDETKAMALASVVSKSFEVNVIDGVGLIDSLVLSVTPRQPFSDGAQPLRLVLTQSQPLDLSVNGQLATSVWNQDKREYVQGAGKTVTLTNMSWTYQNKVPNAPAHQSFISVQKTMADGTAVRVSANPLPKDLASALVTLTVEGAGRRFDIEIMVTK